MEIPVYNLNGEVIKQIEVSDLVFGLPVNKAALFQALIRQQANARQGTACTKTRGDVAGSGRKLYQQKHTGRSRPGPIRTPLRRGGGVAFGPKPRSYAQAMPKKMHRLALRSALSSKAKDGELKILEQLSFEQPKTKQMAQVLTALNIVSSVLVATQDSDQNVFKSTRNIAGVKIIPANQLNVDDMLSYRVLIMTEAAVRKAEELWGEKKSQGVSNATA